MRLDYSLLSVFLLLLIPIVTASDNAPPALPTEYWGNVTVDGNPASDGLSVIGYVSSVQYSSMSGGTVNGYYNIILTNGDRPLTYNDDPNCTIHYAANQACVPCNSTSDCIEGPQDTATILIKVNGTTATPSISWLNGTTTYQNIIVITTGIYNYTLVLIPDWNLISIPIQPFDDKWSTIMAGCDYNKIWEFKPATGWCSSPTCLTIANVTKGYWVDRVGKSGNCTQVIEGIKQEGTRSYAQNDWTLIGYPCIYSQSTSALNQSLWDKLWEFKPATGWCSSPTCLTAFTPGKGYWLDGTSGGFYNITC